MTIYVLLDHLNKTVEWKTTFSINEISTNTDGTLKLYLHFGLSLLDEILVMMWDNGAMIHQTNNYIFHCVRNQSMERLPCLALSRPQLQLQQWELLELANTTGEWTVAYGVSLHDKTWEKNRIRHDVRWGLKDWKVIKVHILLLPCCQVRLTKEVTQNIDHYVAWVL